MPATARQTSRTGLPGGRSEISFRWTPKAIKQLLEIVKNTPDYRATFFYKGLTVRKKSGIARELLLDLVKDEPDYLAFLSARGMIKKDETGRWVPLDTWTSAFNNPASSKLHDLKRTYAKARDEYKIKSHWTKFADLPSNIRRDFVRLYPWYFIYKELDSPTQPFERPPLRISDHPPATTQSPSSDTTRPVARRRRQELPSPSPSDRSTPEPSPPPVPTSSRSFLNLTPTIAAPPTRTTSNFTLGTRPYLRPNAVASSSQIPIEIDTSSSSSSASSSESESESEHEMETYTPEVPPSRSPSPPADVDWLGNGRFPAPSRSVSVGSKSNRAQTPSSARVSQAGPSRRRLPLSESDSESDSSIDIDPAPVPEVKTEASEPYVAHIDTKELEHKPNISYTGAGEQEHTTMCNMPHFRSDRRRDRSMSTNGEPLDGQPIKRARRDLSLSPSAPSDPTGGPDEPCPDTSGSISGSRERRDERIRPSHGQGQIVTAVNHPCPCCKPGEMSSDITDLKCLKARQIRQHFSAASTRIHVPQQIDQRVAVVLKYGPKQYSAYRSAIDIKGREEIILGIQHRLLTAVLQDMLALGVVPGHILDDCVLCFKQANEGTVTAAAVQAMRLVAQSAGATLSNDKRLHIAARDRGERISVSNTRSGWTLRLYTRGRKARKSLQMHSHLTFGAYLYRKLVHERSRPEGSSDLPQDDDQGDSTLEAEPDLYSDQTSGDDTVDLKHDTGAPMTLYKDATVPEKRDLLMGRLRRAVASDPNDPGVIMPRHTHVQESYRAASSEYDKLECLRKYRNHLFAQTLRYMRKEDLLPRLLTDCRLCFDPLPLELTGRKHLMWRALTSAAGAQQAIQEAQLAPGSRRLIRIHIRKDLNGFDVEPETFLEREPRSDGTQGKPLCVRQYSYWLSLDTSTIVSAGKWTVTTSRFLLWRGSEI